jgi:hypothetical protein
MLSDQDPDDLDSYDANASGEDKEDADLWKQAVK